MEENFNWIMRCINSCKNKWQLQTAFKMIELFQDAFGKENVQEQYEELLQAVVDKQAVV